MAVTTLSGIWPEWEVVRQIGSGSFGVVYEAVRKDLQMAGYVSSHAANHAASHAAIKVISIPQSQSEVASLRSEGLSEADTRLYLRDMVDSFVGEILLMETFKGVQNIVSVEDYKVVEKSGEIGWDIYIRMELLTPFTGYLQGKELSEREVVKLGVDICRALELCGKRNVIHRDIKPENIFLNSFGDFKLGDFGIARRLESFTGGLSQKGTYNYMAPEVERGASYDATVDIYSLGLVLYRLLNGNRLPFLETEQQLRSPNARMAAVRRRMDGEPLPPPCNASPEMAKVILCACAYDPRKRFASATAMKNALLAAAGMSGDAAAPEKRTPPQIVTPPSPDRSLPTEGGTVAVRRPPKPVPPQGGDWPAPVAYFAEPQKKRKSRKWLILIAVLVALDLALVGTVLALYLPGDRIRAGDLNWSKRSDGNIHLDLTGNNPIDPSVFDRINELSASDGAYVVLETDNIRWYVPCGKKIRGVTEAVDLTAAVGRGAPYYDTIRTAMAEAFGSDVVYDFYQLSTEITFPTGTLAAFRRRSNAGYTADLMIRERVGDGYQLRAVGTGRVGTNGWTEPMEYGNSTMLVVLLPDA